MVNRILWQVLAVAATFAPMVSSAQETTRGMICTVMDTCDLNRSHLTFDFTPAHDGFRDTPASLNINLHCIQTNWIRSSWSQTLESNDSSWGYWEISRLNNQQLIPYQLIYEPENAWWLERLWTKDFDCNMWNITSWEE